MDTWQFADQIIHAISNMNLRRVIVFSSAVEGTVGGDGDLDIAVVFDESEYQRLAPTRSFLHSEILDRGTVVYEKAG